MPSIAAMETSIHPPEIELQLRWEPYPTDAMLSAIVELIDCAKDDGGTLGYAAPMSAAEASAFARGLRSALRDRTTHALLGTAGDYLRFFCLLTPSPMPNCRHRAELSKGVMHPGHRGRNLLPRVFRAIVRQAESLGIEQLVLDVREGTRAHALWERFGFQTYGVLDDYARVNGQRFRGHFMSQTVASLKQRSFSSTIPGGQP